MDSMGNEVGCHDPFSKSYRKKNQAGQSKKVQLCVSDSVVSQKSVLILFRKHRIGKDNYFLANSAGKLEAFQLIFLFL